MKTTIASTSDRKAKTRRRLTKKQRGVAKRFCTLIIDAGRQDKLRPGDIVGALTGVGGLQADQVGKIDVFATRSYVAVAGALIDKVIEKLRAGKIKGRNFHST